MAKKRRDPDFVKFDDQQLSQHARALARHSQYAYRRHRVRFRDYANAWRCHTSAEAEAASPWFSKSYHPVVFAAVETLIPRFVNALVGRSPFFTVSGKNRESQEWEPHVQALLRHQIEDQSKVHVKLHEFLRTLHIYGTAVARIPWRQRDRAMKRRVFKKSPAAASFNTVKTLLDNLEIEDREFEDVWDVVEETVRIFEGPDFETIDIHDFFPSPKGGAIDELKWCVVRHRLSLHELEEWGDEGVKNIDKLLKAGGGNTYPDIEENDKFNRRQVYGIDEIFNGFGADKEPEYTIFEAWDARGWDYLVSENGVILIDPRKDTYWHGRLPFVDARLHPMKGEFYGRGVAEILEHVGEDYNEVTRQINDSSSFAALPLVVANAQALGDRDRFSLYPGAINMVDGDARNSVDVKRFGEVPASLFNERAHLKNTADWATGVFDVTRGLLGGAGAEGTATGVAAIRHEANLRIAVGIDHFAKHTLSEIIRHYYQLDQQFMRRSPVIRVKEPVEPGEDDWMRVPLQALAGDFDFRPLGSPAQFSPSVVAQQAVSLLQMLPELIGMAQQFPQMKIPNPTELMEIIISAWGWQEREKILATVQELIGGQMMIPGAPADGSGGEGGAVPEGGVAGQPIGPQPGADTGMAGGDSDISQAMGRLFGAAQNAGV